VNRRHNSMTSSCSTLTEVLLAGAIGIALLGVAFRLTYEGWQLCREGSRQAWISQDICLVRRQWREFVHECPPGGWIAQPQRFQAGTYCATTNAQVLVLSRPGRAKEVQLPAGMRAGLAVERVSGQADCAVLKLSWESSFMGKRTTHRVAVVACPQPGLLAKNRNENKGSDG